MIDDLVLGSGGSANALVLGWDDADFHGAVTHGEWTSGLASLLSENGSGAVMGAPVGGEAHGVCEAPYACVRLQD